MIRDRHSFDEVLFCSQHLSVTCRGHLLTSKRSKKGGRNTQVADSEAVSAGQISIWKRLLASRLFRAQHGIHWSSHLDLGITINCHVRLILHPPQKYHRCHICQSSIHRLHPPSSHQYYFPTSSFQNQTFSFTRHLRSVPPHSSVWLQIRR